MSPYVHRYVSVRTAAQAAVRGIPDSAPTPSRNPLTGVLSVAGLWVEQRDGLHRPYKSLIRIGPPCLHRSVTGEFYVRVTVSWVTPGSTAGAYVLTKRPACRWLRWSSYNCADQGSFVIKSLCWEFALRRARADAPTQRPRHWRRWPGVGNAVQRANECLL